MTDDWRLETHDSRPACRRRDAKALCRDVEDSSLTSLALLRAGASLGITVARQRSGAAPYWPIRLLALIRPGY